MAARAGDAEKTGHYGPAVWPLSLEHLGRISSSGLQLLESLAKESRLWGERCIELLVFFPGGCAVLFRHVS